MTANGLPALQALGVSYRYSPQFQEALSEVSITVPLGQVTALLGPNGCGKTTLMYIFLGMLTPLAGEVRVMQKLHREYTRRALGQTIGLVPQQESLHFDLNVEDYVLLGRAPHLNMLDLPDEEDRAAAREAMLQAGVARFRGRTMLTLSGGERQLVVIARVLAQQPAILLMDEPTSHLDLANSQIVLTMIEQLRIAGKTVVFTTHDPNAAAAVADQVVVMEKGRLLAAGTPQETITVDILSAAYGIPVRVIDWEGKPLVLAGRNGKVLS